MNKASEQWLDKDNISNKNIEISTLLEADELIENLLLDYILPFFDTSQAVSQDELEQLIDKLEDTLSKFVETFDELINKISSPIQKNIEPEQAQVIAGLVHRCKSSIRENKSAFSISASSSLEKLWTESFDFSINLFRFLFTVYPVNKFPDKCAKLQIELGHLYRNHRKGDKIKNIENAIYFYQQALKVIFTHKKVKIPWITVLNDISDCFTQIILDKQGNKKREQRIEKALAYLYEIFNRYITEDKDVSLIRKKIADTYYYRLKGNRSDNLEKAIINYEKARILSPNDSSPLWFAEISQSLGSVYLHRKEGERIENLNKAINLYQNAQEIFTQEFTYDEFPVEYAEIRLNLGIAYCEAQKQNKAYEVLSSLAKDIDFLRGNAPLNFDNQEQSVKKWTLLYQKLVETCIEISEDTENKQSLYKEALGFAESSKSYTLKKYLATQNIYSNLNFLPKGEVPPKVIDKLSELRSKLIQQLKKVSQEIIESLSTHLNTEKGLRKLKFSSKTSRALSKLVIDIDNLISNHIAHIDPNFTQRVKLGFEDIQSLIDSNTAVLEYFFTSEYLVIFIITPNLEAPIVKKFSLEHLQQINEWANSYFTEYLKSKNKWEKNWNSNLKKLSTLLEMDDVIESIPFNCDQLIIIPRRILHLLPLHALPLSNDTYVLDRFYRGVRYIPSSEILYYIQNRQRSEFKELFCVQNPTKNLPFSDIEAKFIKHFFQHSYLLEKDNATKENILNHIENRSPHCLHLSCHGKFDFEVPLKSGLVLADAPISSNSEDEQKELSENHFAQNSYLSLGEVLNFELNQCRLVILSACETALTDVSDTSDEYLGLPSAFLIGGSMGVVGSLWDARDLATTLLMIKFYENLYEYQTVTFALNSAQRWLRDIKKSELIDWIQNLNNLDKNDKQKIQKGLMMYAPEEQPFCQSSDWAAFCLIGQ